MAEHSPLPWLIDGNMFETGIGIVIKEQPSMVVCEVWPHDEDDTCTDPDGIAQANADFIMQAVHRHDALIAACKAAHSWLREYHTQMGSPMDADDGVLGLFDQLEEATNDLPIH